ncbi:hypothetical protein BBAD15_g8103 [Beauveria bassiana D1-5]|uniref:Uncharacterized protein n=1 Tax=Beauveria bassiana D1-5 TaxID=1245745 RepID=A0A0A2VKB9_BEABA|nr:hypothetical protein BBAD15_g8103 [Beauveria bassiana D1-5]
MQPQSLINVHGLWLCPVGECPIWPEIFTKVATVFSQQLGEMDPCAMSWAAVSSIIPAKTGVPEHLYEPTPRAELTMRLSYVLSAIAALCSNVALADFTTPTYPTPADLSSNYSLVHAGWKNLTSTWDWYLQGKLNVSGAAAFAGVENVTFSVGLFSLNDPLALKLQYHYTAPEVKTALVGTRKVDEDSIYRVASVSKLITTFAGLLELDDKDWHRPLAQINPAFKRQRKNATAVDVIKTIEWDKITPWALASQLSGLPTVSFCVHLALNRVDS